MCWMDVGLSLFKIIWGDLGLFDSSRYTILCDVLFLKQSWNKNETLLTATDPVLTFCKNTQLAVGNFSDCNTQTEFVFSIENISLMKMKSSRKIKASLSELPSILNPHYLFIYFQLIHALYIFITIIWNIYTHVVCNKFSEKKWKISILSFLLISAIIFNTQNFLVESIYSNYKCTVHL